jgi:heme exporter protein D
MDHAFYIVAAYGITFGLVLLTIALTLIDGRARARELKALEAAGIRRRSQQGQTPDGAPS